MHPAQRFSDVQTALFRIVERHPAQSATHKEAAAISRSPDIDPALVDFIRRILASLNNPGQKRRDTIDICVVERQLEGSKKSFYRPHIVVIGLPSRRWLQESAFWLGLIHVRCKDGHNGSGDLILNRENVFKFPIVALGPTVCPSYRIHDTTIYMAHVEPQEREAPMASAALLGISAYRRFRRGQRAGSDFRFCVDPMGRAARRLYPSALTLTERWSPQAEAEAAQAERSERVRLLLRYMRALGHDHLGEACAVTTA
jgi:hypothetical protein